MRQLRKAAGMKAVRAVSGLWCYSFNKQTSLSSHFYIIINGPAVRLTYRRGLTAVPGDLATRHGHKEGEGENCNWSGTAHGACAKSNDDRTSEHLFLAAAACAPDESTY